MLIAMAGLPGSGKSAVAGEVARALGCAVLSVDPIEAAMWRAGIGHDQPTGLAAYVVAEELAREQLLIGNDVVVDAVNDVEPARQQWRSLATKPWPAAGLRRGVLQRRRRTPASIGRQATRYRWIPRTDLGVRGRA